ncbi:uncharacterized protein LOC117341951 isoform X2 [Pecten maximus]|nr:uncharacterized protein LOC117341951 isoform X2 [Pecten maximus]XP_033759730.1 uncharacterized protein LOC117341951 isoform X2 [Pecten maximus]
MTVKQNTQDKNGRIYIEELHTTLPSDLRPGDELVKLDNVVFTETTTESIQKHFSFDADSNGRRAKTVTIRRTQSEDGETEEIDVEVAIMSKMINAEHASRIQTRFVLPRRRQRLGPRHQARKVQWVQLKRERADKVFIRTSNRKFLTVRNGAIVGEEMGEDNKREFLFDLVPGTAAYSSKYSRLKTKVVICCKLRWNSYWLKTSMGSDGEFEMELTENDTDDHTTVFKRRVKSDGRYGTGFECLLFKNVYIQYYPSRNEVDVKPYNPRINIGVTLKLFRYLLCSTSSNKR